MMVVMSVGIRCFYFDFFGNECCMFQDDQRMRELSDRDAVLHELRRQLDAACEQKRECEQKLAAAIRDVESLTLQLRDKNTEIERSRDLVRSALMLLLGCRKALS